MRLPFAVEHAELIHFVAIALYRGFFDFIRLFDSVYKRGSDGFATAFEFGNTLVFFVELGFELVYPMPKISRFAVMLFVEPRDIIVYLRGIITFFVPIERHFCSLYYALSPSSNIFCLSS